MLGALALAGLLLTGCGATPTVSGAGTGTRVVNITFWHGLSGQLGQVLDHEVSKFNATHPGIHVTPYFAGSYSGNGPEQEKLLAAIAAGKVPDVAQLEIHSTPKFAASGALQPLNSLMAKSHHHQKGNFIPGLLMNTSYQGITYGIPFNRSVPVLYYNKAMFQAAHIANPPQTWSQLKADAARLTGTFGGVQRVGFEPVDQWWFFESLVWSNGGHLMNRSLTRATFDTPQAAMGLALWQRMIQHRTAAVESGPQGWTLTIEDLLNGRTAMYTGSAGDMGQLATGKIPYGAAFIPRFRQYAVPTGGANLVILKNIPAAKQQAAWTFVKWLTAEPQTIYWSEHTGYLPVLTAAVQAMAAYYRHHPNHRVAVEELRYARQAPLSPDYLDVYRYEQQAMDQVLLNGAAVMPSLQSAVRRANGVLG